MRYIDIQLDTAANAFTSFDAKRAAGVRAACEKHGISIGLHTLSAVNVAEYSPYAVTGSTLSRSLYRHLSELGAEWMVVHAGYHFTDRQGDADGSRP